MSLVSASGFITGVKEYIYRGIQEMPLVLILTSLLFVITTGSIAHTSLLIGLIVLKFSPKVNSHLVFQHSLLDGIDNG
jgi:hypothetical protein